MGEHAVTAVVATWPGEGGQPEVHYEVFQVSDQCVQLWKQGWFQQQEEPGGTSTLRNPQVCVRCAAVKAALLGVCDASVPAPGTCSPAAQAPAACSEHLDGPCVLPMYRLVYCCHVLPSRRIPRTPPR
jgi:hypothetical protein